MESTARPRVACRCDSRRGVGAAVRRTVCWEKSYAEGIVADHRSATWRTRPAMGVVFAGRAAPRIATRDGAKVSEGAEVRVMSLIARGAHKHSRHLAYFLGGGSEQCLMQSPPAGHTLDIM
eukprot:1158086-Pelagomonas_calceolata.AAC.3